MSPPDARIWNIRAIQFLLVREPAQDRLSAAAHTPLYWRVRVQDVSMSKVHMYRRCSGPGGPCEQWSL